MVHLHDSISYGLLELYLKHKGFKILTWKNGENIWKTTPFCIFMNFSCQERLLPSVVHLNACINDLGNLEQILEIHDGNGELQLWPPIVHQYHSICIHVYIIYITTFLLDFVCLAWIPLRKRCCLANCSKCAVRNSWQAPAVLMENEGKIQLSYRASLVCLVCDCLPWLIFYFDPTGSLLMAKKKWQLLLPSAEVLWQPSKCHVFHRISLDGTRPWVAIVKILCRSIQPTLITGSAVLNAFARSARWTLATQQLQARCEGMRGDGWIRAGYRIQREG